MPDGGPGIRGRLLGTCRNILLYVDGANGSDENDGLTRATPVQTIEAAHHRAPCIIGPSTRVVVEIAGVGGFYPSAAEQAVYDVENVMLPSGGNAELQRFQYRGPNMVPSVPTTGPAAATISGLTSLWWPIGNHARTRTASVNEPATGGGITGWVLAGTRISRTGGANWTVNDTALRFLRVMRAGKKVIFECPIARNGTTTIDLDIAQLPDGTKLASALQVGDTIELVKPGAKLTNSQGISITIEGHGGCSGPYDHDQNVATRGGGGFWMERLELDRRFMAFGCWGLSFDRCDFTTAGDENYYGGSGVWVNCLHTSLGMLMHGNFSVLHDTANCRPDVASDGAAADPIYQDVDAFSCWGVLRAPCRMFVGSGTSSSPAYFTLERNLSIYDAPSEGALFLGYGARFVHVDQRSRNVVVQGTGNPIGVDVQGGSQAVVVLGKIHLLGDHEDGEGLDDCRLGAGVTKTWDEFHAGGYEGNMGGNNWLYDTFNFSRLTAYTT